MKNLREMLETKINFGKHLKIATKFYKNLVIEEILKPRQEFWEILNIQKFYKHFFIEIFSKMFDKF